MSVCSCPKTERRWWVLKRGYHESAFDGYRRTWSDYSTVICDGCHRTWRTKAKYVAALPDAAPEKGNTE